MNCGTISKLLAPTECKPGITSIRFNDPVNGCTVSTSDLPKYKNVFFLDKDLVFENGKPSRTKRSYGKNKRPSPIIKFAYGDHNNK